MTVRWKEKQQSHAGLHIFRPQYLPTEPRLNIKVP